MAISWSATFRSIVVLGGLLGMVQAASAVTYYTRSYSAVGGDSMDTYNISATSAFSIAAPSLDVGTMFVFGDSNIPTATVKSGAAISGGVTGHALSITGFGDTLYYEGDPGVVRFLFLLDGGFDPIVTSINASYVEFTAVPVGQLVGSGLSTDTYTPDIIYRKTVWIGPANPNNPTDVFDYCDSPDCSVRNVVPIDRASAPTAIPFVFSPGGDFSFQITFVIDGTVTDSSDLFAANFSNIGGHLRYSDSAVPLSASGQFPIVPEPATTGLFGLGAAAMLFFRFRKSAR